MDYARWDQVELEFVLAYGYRVTGVVTPGIARRRI
jgi:hypothetical protein